MLHPVSQHQPGVLVASVAAQVSLKAPVARLSLRAKGDVTPLTGAFGVSLPSKIGTCAETDRLSAVRLGPDEWVLKAEVDDLRAILSAGERLYDTLPHSLVDVSGREVTLELSGPKVLDLLTLGMARDPEMIPVGDARRLNFDGVTVLLWRKAEDRFEMDIWHSFAPHLLSLLKTGVAELAAEV